MLKFLKSFFQKNAALYIGIFDCCNAFVKGAPDDRPGECCAFELKKGDEPLIACSFKKLFAKPRGLIIASAAAPGRVGRTIGPSTDPYWFNYIGGVLTSVLLNNLFCELKSPSPCWKNILKKTKAVVAEETSKRYYTHYPDPLNPTLPQLPQYKIFLHRHRRDKRTYRKYLYHDCKPRKKKAATGGEK